MEFPYKNEIVSLNAFNDIFSELKSVDFQMGLNIEQSLKAAISTSHNNIITASSIDQLHLALIKEQIAIQAQSSQYLNITDEVTLQKVHLLEFMPKVYHEFMNEVEYKLQLFFDAKKSVMLKEVENDASWYSGFRDTTKKGGGTLLNAALKTINDSYKKIQGKDAFSEEHLVDTKTIVETVLEKYLNTNAVVDYVSKIFSEASKNYEEKWVKEISTNVPNIKRLSAFSLADKARFNINVNFQLGQAEQVLAMGLGSAVVGTVGLAIGWHTLTYSMMNVFPPIAIFAALATIIVGVLTKDKAVEKRKRDIDETVNRYLSFFLHQLYVMKLTELGNLSISQYMETQGKTIVDGAIEAWEKNIFGELKTEHFRKLNQAFVTHLLYVNEALETLTI